MVAFEQVFFSNRKARMNMKSLRRDKKNMLNEDLSLTSCLWVPSPEIFYSDLLFQKNLAFTFCFK